jgi:acyl carrier protein
LEQLQHATPDEASALLTPFVSAQLAAVMGFASGAEVDIDQDFSDMGIDSLLAVDLRNRLEASLAITLPATLVFDHPDLASLIDHLAQLMTRADQRSDDPTADDADDEEAALLAEIEQLSDEEAERLLSTPVDNGDDTGSGTIA